MPVEYTLDASRCLIRTRFAGPVTFDEVIGHLRELETHPDLPERVDVLLDFGELTGLPDGQQVRTVASEIGKLRPRIELRRCAIFAPRDVLYGIGRMFEMVSEPHFGETQVFRSLAEAERWLASAPRPGA